MSLSWVDDLVATDPDVRTAALASYHRGQETLRDFWARYQDLANEMAGRDPNQLRYRKLLDRFAAERPVAEAGSLLHLLTIGWLGGVDRGDLVHYALRYLEWETRHPGDWPRSWSIKRQVLWQLSRRPMCARHRAMAADVVVLAASRTQQCEDDRYVLLARAVDSADLRVALAAGGNDRARFLLYMLDHPELAASLHSWRLFQNSSPAPEI